LKSNAIKIPLSRPDITTMEIKRINDVLKTPYLSRGPIVERFENELRKYTGTEYAIAVNSGTSALHLIIKSLGIGKGDEVITTPFSFIASSNCILYENARPVFVDIDPVSFNIDVDKIEERITQRTKAILAVDVFGYPAEWARLEQLAEKYKLKLIEDSCEALGSEYHHKKTGSFGYAAAFGFYPNKQITTGEGGMITTNDPDIARSCHMMRNHGRAYANSWLDYEILGYNYRISDINAALGFAQLERFDEIMEARDKVALFYNCELSGFDLLDIPCSQPDRKRSWFVYVIILKNNYTRSDRDLIMEELGKKGIECGYYFAPIHLQPFYVKLFNYKQGDFPITESVSYRTIALPFYNRLKQNEIKYVAASLKDIIQSIKKGGALV
jgi:perosamine synthetase